MAANKIELFIGGQFAEQLDVIFIIFLDAFGDCGEDTVVVKGNQETDVHFALDWEVLDGQPAFIILLLDLCRLAHAYLPTRLFNIIKSLSQTAKLVGFYYLMA